MILPRCGLDHPCRLVAKAHGKFLAAALHLFMRHIERGLTSLVRRNMRRASPSAVLFG